MIPERADLGIDRSERRRAQLGGLAALCLMALVDLWLAYSPVRLAVWGAWAACFALSSLVITRGPAWVLPACGLGTSIGSVVAMLALAALDGGPASPYFLMVSIVPLLMATAVPEDLFDSVACGLVILAGGTVLLVRQGRSARDVLVWAAIIFLTATYALVTSLRHRRRQELALTRELERATMVEQLARSERARSVAERWATIGRVADAVAHDVNSPLASLRSNLAFAREELSEGRTTELDDALLDGQQSAERIKEIVLSLQAFSRADADENESRELATREAETPAPGSQPVAAAAPVDGPAPGEHPAPPGRPARPPR